MATADENHRTLYGALSALAAACFGSEYKKSEITDRLIRDGIGSDDPEGLIPLVRAEKDRIAPDCKTCTHPCGRTKEIDINALMAADPELYRKKTDLMAWLREHAPELSTDKLYEGIRAYGEDYTLEGFDAFLDYYISPNRK